MSLTIRRAGSHWPLYRIDADARADRLGEMHAPHGDACWFESTAARPALMHGDFATGCFPACRGSSTISVRKAFLAARWVAASHATSMRTRTSRSGVPAPEQRDDAREAAGLAGSFWSVSLHTRGFRPLSRISEGAREMIDRASRIA